MDFASRKFLIAVAALALLVGFAVFATFKPAAQGMLGQLVTGVLGVLATYSASNIISKAVAGQQGGTVDSKDFPS